MLHYDAASPPKPHSRAVIDRGILTPERPDPKFLNPHAVVPFGMTPCHVLSAMNEFTEFLCFIDTQLCSKSIPRFEEMLMPANFSSVISEFMGANIPKYCKTIVKNAHHNGHPDLLPAGKYPKNMAQHAGIDGIEIKASRYAKAWQGHNAEDAWLMVFVFQAGRPRDLLLDSPPVQFRFLTVLGAELSKADWQFAGRSATSRRTITASVKQSGYEKMSRNWLYRVPDLGSEAESDLIPFDTDE